MKAKLLIAIAARAGLVLAGLVPLFVGRWLSGEIMLAWYYFPQGAVRLAWLIVLGLWFVLGIVAALFIPRRWEAVAWAVAVPTAVAIYMVLWAVGAIGYPFIFPLLNLELQNYVMPLMQPAQFILRPLFFLTTLPHSMGSFAAGGALALAILSWTGYTICNKIRRR